MARSSTTFKKRQKELARLEKARDKKDKRATRKAQKQSRGTSSLDDAIDFNASVYDFIPDEYSPVEEEEEAAEETIAEGKK